MAEGGAQVSKCLYTSTVFIKGACETMYAKQMSNKVVKVVNIQYRFFSNYRAKKIK